MGPRLLAARSELEHLKQPLFARHVDGASVERRTLCRPRGRVACYHVAVVGVVLQQISFLERFRTHKIQKAAQALRFVAPDALEEQLGALRRRTPSREQAAMGVLLGKVGQDVPLQLERRHHRLLPVL